MLFLSDYRPVMNGSLPRATQHQLRQSRIVHHECNQVLIYVKYENCVFHHVSYRETGDIGYEKSLARTVRVGSNPTVDRKLRMRDRIQGRQHVRVVKERDLRLRQWTN